MPSANGVYSLPPGYLAVTGATIQASQHNPPLEDIAAALTARLSRDGTAAMTGAIQLLPGTVGLPGAVFSTDLTTGFYKTTNGIGVAVGGVKSVEFTGAGIATGNRLIGELVPYTCVNAPSALWVLPYGQTLLRATYPALWTQAQIEIAAGNTFYNNGDGSTTFGIGDMRGRIAAAKDNMGGTPAGRLTSAGSSIDGNTLGTPGGSQNVTLTQANLPNVVPTIDASTVQWNSVALGSTSINYTPGGTAQSIINTGFNGGTTGGGVTNYSSKAGISSGAITVSSINGNVAQTTLNNTQPTMVTNYILFVGGAT